VIHVAAAAMPSVQGDNDDVISNCSDLSSASLLEDEAEEDASEIDTEYDVINGSVYCVVFCHKQWNMPLFGMECW